MPIDLYQAGKAFYNKDAANGMKNLGEFGLGLLQIKGLKQPIILEKGADYWKALKKFKFKDTMRKQLPGMIANTSSLIDLPNTNNNN